MEKVLLFDEEQGTMLGYLFKRDWFVQTADGLRLRRVTHWMNVPGVPDLN
jgi:hypothetical protein